jgi:L-asparagine transporter-like permease
MDVLILLSAVLLFFCVFLAIAQTIPPWPATLALIAGVAGFFTALYWWICAWMGCETVGAQLARIALPDSVHPGAQEQVRFR